MIRRILLASAYLLLSFISFPGIDAGWAAWFCMVPLFVLLSGLTEGRRFFSYFFLLEWLKWIALIIWLRHVSWFAVIGIAALFAVYQGWWFFALRRILGVEIAQGFRRLGFFKILCLSALWAAMEWLRTQPFGLPGAHFSITQWKYPIVLQLVSCMGGYGLSGLLVAINLSITKWLFQIINTCELSKWKRSIQFGMGMLSILIFVFVYGKVRLGREMESGAPIRIGIVQPYTPPYRYWTYEHMTETVRTVLDESIRLLSGNEVDFLVWPEGTLPGSIYTGSPMEFEVKELCDRFLKVPLLFGNQMSLDGKLYNAVMLCVPGEGINASFYAKRILVPFGEFIPGRKWLKGIETIVPIPEDFERGVRSVPIKVPLDLQGINISSQICYEDCFPDLLLNDALETTDLLFVATYNAWYGEEFGAYFHAAHSVLRAVENGRPLLRCGNAGWSGLIDAYGRICSVVRSTGTGSIYFRGSAVVTWDNRAKLETFYKRYHVAIHIFYCLIAGLGFLRNKHFRESNESRGATS